MHIGMVGLGRMGANMSRRLMQAGHAVTAWDVSSDAVQALSEVNGDTGILQQLAHYVVTRDH